ncbi:MAG: hypothetical protein BGO41_14775 [Clostridiales bacterium 38-18]|nr:MAG: hypothetical protein BGO41_14775 [Clostridiales bacterium 38-18]
MELLERYRLKPDPFLEGSDLQSKVEVFFNTLDKKDIYQHTIEVLEELELHKLRYSLDTTTYERCKIGVLLHDVGRVIPAETVFDFCESFGYIATNCEKNAPSILHQICSRFLAEFVFNIKDEAVLEAIECHTTLKAEPSLIAKIVHLSDKTSWKEKEDQPLVKKLREATDLDEALFIYQKHMYDQRHEMKCYHPWSYAAYLILKEKVEGRQSVEESE